MTLCARIGRKSLGCFVVLLAACTSKRPTPLSCDTPPNGPEGERTLEIAGRFERDEGFRRTCLEASLVNHQNGYSKARLTHYRAVDWGKLPIAAFKSRPVVPGDLGKPIPSPNETWQTVPFGKPSGGVEGLRDRGKQMFTRFPAQVERSMIPILRDPAGPSRYGLWQTADSVGGLVWVALPGGVFPSLTCSSCHASVDDSGKLQLGVPNHRINLGKAVDDYTGMPSLYSTWGEGRVDIAADGRDNPVVIADVRAVRYQSYLHRTANIKNSLMALALRVETGLIVAHRSAVRPESRDAFALAYYLWRLGDSLDGKASARHPGRESFEKHCASCHAGSAHAGKPVLAQMIQSPTADMASEARGTGKVQVTSLLGVSARQRLLYDGTAHDFQQLLDPNRQTGGHYVGKGLSDRDRHSLVAYLQTL